MTEVILALDVGTRDAAVSIAEKTGPYLDAIKIGYPLVLAAGLTIADELSAGGLPLIADFKVADIPNTSRLIAEEVFFSWVFRNYLSRLCRQGFCTRLCRYCS